MCSLRNLILLFKANKRSGLKLLGSTGLQEPKMLEANTLGILANSKNIKLIFELERSLTRQFRRYSMAAGVHFAKATSLVFGSMGLRLKRRTQATVLKK